MSSPFSHHSRPNSRPGFYVWATILSLGALVLIALGALLLLGIVRLRPVEDLATAEDTVVLFALSAFNLVAFLIFSFILARMMLRLRRERHERRLGSHLKSRLLKYFALISILPLVVLALFSYLFINRTVEKWFSNPLDVIMRDSDFLGKQYAQAELENLRDTTRTLGRLIESRSSASGSAAEEDQIAIEMDNHELLLVRLIDRRGQVSYQRIRPGTAMPAMMSPVFDRLTAEAMNGTAASDSVKTGDETERYLVAAEPLAGTLGVLVAAYQTPLEVLQRELRIKEQRAVYESLRQKNRQFRKSSLYTLGVITFLLLFVAAWVANRLGREITVPVQALAEATARVAGGDLDQQVECEAEDELALLVKSFNEMTSQLRENRRRLEESARSLQTINRTLDERRRYIETVIESLTTGIVSLDSANRVTTINSAAERIFQLKSDLQGEELNQALRDVLTEQRLETIVKLLRTTRRRGFATTEMEIPTLSGTQHLVIAASALRGERQEPQGAVIMIEDISELVRAQRSTVWSEVARRMAHEIKNPLTPIRLSAERIAKQLDRGSDLSDDALRGMVSECTSTIVGEVGTLQRMVDEFTRFARLPETNLVEGSLNQATEAAIRLYDGLADGSNIQASLDPNLPPVLIDHEQVKRVIVNLIDNALEALRDVEGERRIVAETDYLPDQDMVRLSISDSGKGISPEIRDKLFTPYFSTRERGTGLGLAIVSRIVMDHGGRIRVEDNHPRGARFIIDFPVVVGERRILTPELIA